MKYRNGSTSLEANSLRQAKALGDYLIVGIHSDDEIKITDISEKSSLKNRTITMKINEKEVSVNLSKDNTCFDESLVYQINKVLEESKSEKLLYYIKMRLLYRWSHFYFLPAVSVHNDCEKGKKFVIIIIELKKKEKK